MKSLLPLGLIAWVAVAPVAGETHDASPDDLAANIHFSLAMLHTDAAGNTTEQTVETLSASDRGARTQAGWRVPIPVTRSNAAEGGETPITSFQYQDVGLALSLKGRAVRHDRVRASGHVEITGVDRPDMARAATTSAPQIGTFSHRFEATLLDGVPTTLVAVPRPDGGSVRLTLTALIQP